MRKLSRSRRIPFIAIITFVALLSSCIKMNTIIRDDSTGLNGSFEIVKSGFPVNWLLYTPQTVPNSDFEIIIDTTQFHEGGQSLKFLVRECAATGGWLSPGFTNEYYSIPGQTYTVRFWVKNSGSKFSARIGGVSAFEGDYQDIVTSADNIEHWQQFEYQYTMPAKDDFDRLRFELNILEPGIFWIDDLTIENMYGVSVIPTSR